MDPSNGALYDILKKHERSCCSSMCSLTLSAITADQSSRWTKLTKISDKKMFEQLVSAYLFALEPAAANKKGNEAISPLANKASRQAALQQLLEVPEILSTIHKSDHLTEAQMDKFKESLITWAVGHKEGDVLKGTDANLRDRLKKAKLLEGTENKAIDGAEKEKDEEKVGQPLPLSLSSLSPSQLSLCCCANHHAGGNSLQ